MVMLKRAIEEMARVQRVSSAVWPAWQANEAVREQLDGAHCKHTAWPTKKRTNAAANKLLTRNWRLQRNRRPRELPSESARGRAPVSSAPHVECAAAFLLYV